MIGWSQAFERPQPQIAPVRSVPCCSTSSSPSDLAPGPDLHAAPRIRVPSHSLHLNGHPNNNHPHANGHHSRHHGHPTLHLIKQRHLERSKPGNRSDEFKLGLVVEGGGMQGIISAAMLHQLHLLGLRECFDAVYGASAGAVNGAFFLAQQPRGLDIYTEDLVDGRFLDLTMLLPRALRMIASAAPNPPSSSSTSSSSPSSSSSSVSPPRSLSSRAAAAARKAASFSSSVRSALSSSSSGKTTPPSSTRHAMDLKYLLEHVMVSVKPLDWQAVIDSPVPLKVVVSSLDLLRPIILDSFTDQADLVNCLAASATVPEVAGPPRLVRGHRCVDAAVFEPVPVASAIRDGCTHVLVLCTRTSASVAGGSRTAPVARATKRAVVAAVKKTFLNAPYMKEAWQCGYSSADVSDEEILNAQEGTPVSRQRLGAYVMPIYPGGLKGVHPVCTDVPTLRAARAEGYRAVRQGLARPLGLGLSKAAASLHRKQRTRMQTLLVVPEDGVKMAGERHAAEDGAASPTAATSAV